MDMFTQYTAPPSTGQQWIGYTHIYYLQLATWKYLVKIPSSRSFRMKYLYIVLIFNVWQAQVSKIRTYDKNIDKTRAYEVREEMENARNINQMILNSNIKRV